MANNYAVVRLDRVTGTRDGSKLLSARYYVNTTATDIQNGNVVHITNELLDREVFKTTAPAQGDTIKTVGLVASVELIKDSSVLVDDLTDFINKADGEPQRVYLLETGDIFSVTAPAINNLPATAASAKGKFVKLGTTTKWEYAATDTDAVGTIIDVEVVGSKTYFVIRIK
jgi:hypothetical protein